MGTQGYGWIHMCMDGSMYAQADPFPMGVHGEIHGHTCAWLDPHVLGWIHMCTSRPVCTGVHEGICEHMDGSVCKGAHKQIHLGTENPPVPGVQKPPSSALLIFLFAACLFAGSWKQLVATR